jgi:hypothetical protein
MSIRKVILLAMLPIPLLMMVVALSQKFLDPGLEMAFTVIGIPILVLNMWEWTIPKGEVK